MERILLYHCRALLMDEADTLLEGAYVVVEGETISSVGTQRPQGPFDREIDCGNNVLMPGLVNAHTHIPMTLLRGYGGGVRPAHLAQPVDLPHGGQAGRPGGPGRHRAGPGRAHRRRGDHHR